VAAIRGGAVDAHATPIANRIKSSFGGRPRTEPGEETWPELMAWGTFRVLSSDATGASGSLTRAFQRTELARPVWMPWVLSMYYLVQYQSQVMYEPSVSPLAAFERRRSA
jgi:hypothetical protein